MKFLIGGDFCITKFFLSENLFDTSIIKIFKESAYNLVNLECPVTADEPANKILKTGPNLRTDEQIFEKLKNLNINAVTLANNHLMDYGEKGLHDTLHGCKTRGYDYVGAGVNLDKASIPLYIEKDGLKIAFINFCEHEWSIATPDKGGANPLDLIDNTAQIKNAKKEADFVIVIVHGGHEYYHFPSPRMVKQYRYFAENGADAVIGHHTHCFSGYEIYNNIPIAYSLGNMIFTHDSKHNAWYTGLLAQLHIEKNNPIKINLIPIYQTPKTFKLKVFEGIEKDNILTQLNELSLIIKSSNLLQSEWEKYVESKKRAIEIFSPINTVPGRYMRAALKRLGLNKYLLKKRLLKDYLNHVRCETHRDILIETITKRLK